MNIVFVVTGLVLLLLAGDALVRGAVNLGLRLGVPALIISLTVVAFGTSAPELLIAIKAALNGAPALAIGNVVGSNTANILMVLGIPALLAGINTSKCDSRKNYAFMIGATVIFIALCFMGPIGIWHGVILLALMGSILTESFLTAQRHRRNNKCERVGEPTDIDEADPTMPKWKIALYLVLGLIGLPLGAQILIEGALGLARVWGVSESVIGLTLVAFGTSLPELSTTVMAALRKHGDVALGNAIGSNIFNLLGIMGITSFFGPLQVPPEILSFDLWVMLGSSLLLLPFVFWRLNITRIWGAALTGLYILYLSVLLA
ncbi:MAG: calcium/sodium antiporter [Alphaproteobacteria bacterium]|nr:calcium/sodium antiporter [Alphaproteobacteria bacterium]